MTDLITDAKDERLGIVDTISGSPPQYAVLYRDSLHAALEREEAYKRSALVDRLNAALTRAEVAEAALCRMKEVLAEARIALWDAHPKIPLEREIDGKIREVLSSSAPCRHGEEAKRVSEAVEWTDLLGGDSREKDALGWWIFDNLTGEDSARTILRKFLAELRRRTKGE